MAAMIVSAQKANEFQYASSDVEFEQNLQEAIEASIEDYAFRIQLEETLQLSNFTFGYDGQQAEKPSLPPVSNPSSSKDEASSSCCKDEKEYMPDNYNEEDSSNVGENGGNSKGKEVDTGLESRLCAVQVQKPVPLELCGICFEDSATEISKDIHCLHRFCHSCMTIIHTQVEQKKHQIYCPHESCREALNPQKCRYFLPAEIIEAWSALIVEAEIPESQKVYCPFPHCSGMLVKEDVGDLSAMEIVNAECPFCNRMFCVKCMVPWHADLDCEEFQTLPGGERSEEDRQLFKLAEAQRWQRCGNCKSLIELTDGCHHMTCRCRHEFCYGCGIAWTSGSHSCRGV